MMADHEPSRPKDSERWKSFQVRTSRPDLPQLSGVAKPFAVTAAISVFALIIGALGTYSADVNDDASPISETNASQPSQTELAPRTPAAGEDTGASQASPEPDGEKSAAPIDSTEENEVENSEQSENNTANGTVESGQQLEEERASATAVPVAPSPTKTSTPNQNPSPIPSPSPSAKSNPAVPNLSGLSKTQAVTIITALGLRRWASSDICSDVVPSGKIVYSIPPAGSVLDLDFHNGESTESYFWFYTSSGVCDNTGYEVARRPPGWGSAYEPGIPSSEARLITKNAVIVGRWLSIDHEWNLEPYKNQLTGQEMVPSAEIRLDYGASCTVTLDSGLQLPCLDENGTRKTSRVISPGNKATERFLIDLAQNDMRDPIEVTIDFFMDGPEYGYHKQVITHRFYEGWN